MENASFLGVPLPLWGFLCFILSAVFVFVWPKSRARVSTSPIGTHYVLRWFEPLGWVSIAMACFLSVRNSMLAIILMALGVVAHVIFLITFFRNPPTKKKSTVQPEPENPKNQSQQDIP